MEPGRTVRVAGEQQTEIAWRHFVKDQPDGQKMRFYRIDTELKEDIALDDAGKVDLLREYGEQLAELIDWEKILDGTVTSFEVDYKHRLFPQYAKETL